MELTWFLACQGLPDTMFVWFYWRPMFFLCCAFNLLLSQHHNTIHHQTFLEPLLAPRTFKISCFLLTRGHQQIIIYWNSAHVLYYPTSSTDILWKLGDETIFRFCFRSILLLMQTGCRGRSRSTFKVHGSLFDERDERNSTTKVFQRNSFM